MEFISKNLKETADFAKNFVSELKTNENVATIVGLYGELGSGKTTFMKYLAETLGVKETIQSPTFVIMKRYGSLIHIDAYRLDNGEDLKKLGWDEMIADPKNLICIEWPEKVADIISPDIKIHFEHVSENERKIEIEKNYGKQK